VITHQVEAGLRSTAPPAIRPRATTAAMVASDALKRFLPLSGEASQSRNVGIDLPLGCSSKAQVVSGVPAQAQQQRGGKKKKKKKKTAQTGRLRAHSARTASQKVIEAPLNSVRSVAAGVDIEQHFGLR